MKVGILSSGLGHVFRGAEGWSQDIAAALYEKEADVTLFKGGGKKKYDYEVVVKCLQRGLPKTQRMIKFFRLFSGWRFGLGSEYDLEQISFALNVRKYLKKYDIIHTKDAKVALILQRFKKFGLIKPEIVLSHGTEEADKRLRKIKYVQQLAPHHLEESKKKGIAKKNWFWLPNLVDVDLFKPMGKEKSREMFDIPKDAFVIFQAAAIRRLHKRIDFAIDTIAKLKAQTNKKIVYVLAGGKEEDSEELIEYGKEKLGDSFKYYVNIEHNKMPHLYSAADLFLLTSIKEMFGTVLIEAMSCGTPAVASSFPVQKWIVGPGGDIADMVKQDEVIMILKKYMTDSVYLEEKKGKSRDWIVKNFSKDVVVDMYIKKYKEIVGEK